MFNRITFSGTTGAGSFSEQAFQKRFTDTSIERLELLKNVIKNIEISNTKITNTDYQKCSGTRGRKCIYF